MTFLELGQAEFVCNPQPELAEFFAEQYDEHAQLLADAADPDSMFSIHQVVAATHNTVKAVSPSGQMNALWSAAAEFRTGFRRIAPLDQP